MHHQDVNHQVLQQDPDIQGRPAYSGIQEKEAGFTVVSSEWNTASDKENELRDFHQQTTVVTCCRTTPQTIKGKTPSFHSSRNLDVKL